MRKLHILAAIFLLSSFSVFIFMLNKHREEVRYKQYIIHKEAIALKKNIHCYYSRINKLRTF